MATKASGTTMAEARYGFHGPKRRLVTLNPSRVTNLTVTIVASAGTHITAATITCAMMTGWSVKRKPARIMAPSMA